MLEMMCSIVIMVLVVILAGLFSLAVTAGVLAFIYLVRDCIYSVRDCIYSVIDHVKRWNKWRKRNTNGWFHKFMVLIGLRVSPTMILMLDNKEINEIAEAVNNLTVSKEVSNNEQDM